MKIILISVYNSDCWRWFEWSRTEFQLMYRRIYSYEDFCARI